MSSWWKKSALKQAEAIRTKQVTSRQIVQEHLDRIEEVNPKVNAIVRSLSEEALAAADRADQAVARGDALGALHGVPCTVKENIDLGGAPTTWGVAAMAEAIAPGDAPQVERLRAAGAIPIGRTNLPDMGLRVNTDSQLHGRTLNPWDTTRTAGGSSGGEAAAIATGMSPLGLGNDVGGSLRNPAHCCGIASIKPTTGVIPTGNVIPPQDLNIAFQLMAVEGVLAREVADVRAGFEALAGQHVKDPMSVPARLTDLKGGEHMRVAVLAEPPGGDTAPGVAQAVRQAADALSNAGHEILEVTPPHYEETLKLWSKLLSHEVRLMKPMLDQLMGEGGRTFLNHGMTTWPELSSAEFSEMLTRRYGVVRAWSQWFQDHPVLLTPVWTEIAFGISADVDSEQGAHKTLELMRPVMPPNVLGLPAAVVCAGLSEGMPVGVQVIGDRYTDLRCLSVAQQIEDRLGVRTPIDPKGGSR